MTPSQVLSKADTIPAGPFNSVDFDVDFATVSGYCLSTSHNADPPQFIAAAHPENRDTQYWATRNTYIGLTKVARFQQSIVVSRMLGACLKKDRGEGTNDPLPPPSDEHSELSSSSALEGIPSLD